MKASVSKEADQRNVEARVEKNESENVGLRDCLKEPAVVRRLAGAHLKKTRCHNSRPGAMVGIRLGPTNLIRLPVLSLGDTRPFRVQTDAYHRPLLLK